MNTQTHSIKGFASLGRCGVPASCLHHFYFLPLFAILAAAKQPSVAAARASMPGPGRLEDSPVSLAPLAQLHPCSPGLAPRASMPVLSNLLLSLSAAEGCPSFKPTARYARLDLQGRGIVPQLPRHPAAVLRTRLEWAGGGNEKFFGSWG